MPRLASPCFLCLFWILTATSDTHAFERKRASKQVRPNIVFFFADDQTSSALGCYGNELVSTPTIDRLAREGTRFDNMFVSHSICWVSRTTILTGLTGRTYGTPGNRDQARPEAVRELVTDIMRTHGYRTGQFGKWHAKMPKGYRREDHFDEFEAIGRNPFLKPIPSEKASSTEKRWGDKRHETDLIVDRGIEFLKSQPAEQPFLLNLWFNACHAEDSDRRPGIGHYPWPASVDGLYDKVTMPLPQLNDAKIFDALPDFLKTSINRERFFWRWNTPEKIQTNTRAYYRMVSGIDRAMKRLIDELERLGIADNTIIVYSADNGYHMANRGLAGKWSHFEESLRVPLIIYDPRPNAKSSHVVSAPALNLDLPATFLDLANIEIPERYEGRSLKPLLSGDEKIASSWRDATFHEHFAVRHRIPAFEGIRTERFKYVRYVDHDFEFLHDLKSDPDELENLIDNVNFKDVAREMREKLAARVEQLGGPLLPPKQPFSLSTKPYPEAAASVGARAGKDGFVKIFNGKSLQGWSGDRKLWHVENGAIVGETNGKLKHNQFLTWKNSTVQNFDLRMQVKISEQGNSGIQYRSVSRPDVGLGVVSGYQCDISTLTPGYNGMLYEERGRRILARTGQKVAIVPNGTSWIVDQFEKPKLTPDQWMDFRIVAQANHLEHYVNGIKTCDVTDFDREGRRLEGVLAIQIHRGPPMRIEIKNVRIKHLSDDLPLQSYDPTAVPADAIGVKPQGKLPSSWKAPVFSESFKNN